MSPNNECQTGQCFFWGAETLMQVGYVSLEHYSCHNMLVTICRSPNSCLNINADIVSDTFLNLELGTITFKKPATYLTVTVTKGLSIAD